MAPGLALFETANVLRRTAMSDQLDQAQAAQAQADLLALPIELWPYEPLAARAWELRHNLSTYDASYVALAELQDSRSSPWTVEPPARPGFAARSSPRRSPTRKARSGRR